MSDTAAAAECTVAESAAESTATETMLGAKRRSAMPAVEAARTVSGRAVRAAGVPVTRAASENDDGGHRQNSVERPSPWAEIRR